MFGRSYTALYSLWFVRAEEKCGLEAALDVDDAIRRVLPRVQVRLLKDMTGMAFGLEAPRECFTAKLAIEGFRFDVEAAHGGLRVMAGYPDRSPAQGVETAKPGDSAAGRTPEPVEVDCSLYE